MLSTLRYDVTGSALGAQHTIAVGTPVRVTRYGVVQPWAVEVFRHDRNGTYRLRFVDTDTYVTAHADEVEPLA
jgi:hypothetical protein